MSFLPINHKCHEPKHIPYKISEVPSKKQDKTCLKLASMRHNYMHSNSADVRWRICEIRVKHEKQEKITQKYICSPFYDDLNMTKES